jgi:putative transport protein
MDWLTELFTGTGTAHSIFVIALVVGVGLVMNKVKIGSLSLGVTWVLFAGITAGHLGWHLDPTVAHFAKEFGLILFVYSIGMEVGPGFFASFRKGGLTLNLLAATVVVLGCLTTLVLHWSTGESLATLVGVMSGAVTNTPSLGAAQQTLSDMTSRLNPTLAQGYAVAYPLGVVGVMLCMLTLRKLLRVDYKKEEEILRKESGNNQNAETVEAATLEVANEAVCGKTLNEIKRIFGRKYVVTRILHRASGDIELVNAQTTIQRGDRLFVVADPAELEALTVLIGPRITQMDERDWNALEANQLVSSNFIVTNSTFNGKRLSDLRLRQTFNVNITRIHRAGIELIATPHLMLQLGDTVTVVGKQNNVDELSSMMGNSMKKLNEPNLIPYFLGIALGVLVGSLPIVLPGMPVPVKIGMAGGPLIIAILMGYFGPSLKIVTYTTTSANHMLRSVGLSIFLAIVGIGAGDGFLHTIATGGYWWVVYGFIITFIPCLLTSLLARWKFRLSYFSIAGMLSGAMTNAPSMAYALEGCDNNQIPVAYSTVFPLTTFLRVLSAQLMILLCI